MRIVTGCRQYQKQRKKKCFWCGLFFCVFEKGGGICLRIAKILNNNVVISVDKNGEDIIVMGSGIAFQKKHGDLIDEKKVERIFTRQVPELAAKFQKLLSEIPMEYLEITEQIMLAAKKSLNYDFDDNLYLALMDHIHFAVQRYHDGMLIENRLLTEIQMMYPEEFEVGMDALKRINKTFDVALPEDEAAFIAFHFVNASTAGTMQDTIQRTRIVKDALTIIKNYFKIEFQENALDYYRLVTHLKFFVRRMTEGKVSPDSDVALLEIVKNNYKDSYECVERIAKYIHLEFGYLVSSEERLYLTIHIERIRELHAENEK